MKKQEEQKLLQQQKKAEQQQAAVKSEGGPLRKKLGVKHVSMGPGELDKILQNMRNGDFARTRKELEQATTSGKHCPAHSGKFSNLVLEPAAAPSTTQPLVLPVPTTPISEELASPRSKGPTPLPRPTAGAPPPRPGVTPRADDPSKPVPTPQPTDFPTEEEQQGEEGLNTDLLKQNFVVRQRPSRR